MLDKLTEKEINLLLSLKNQRDHEYTMFDSKSDEHNSLLDRKLISKVGNLLSYADKERLKSQNPHDERLSTYPRIKITSEGKRWYNLHVEELQRQGKSSPLKVGIIVAIVTVVLTAISTILIG